MNDQRREKPQLDLNGPSIVIAFWLGVFVFVTQSFWLGIVTFLMACAAISGACHLFIWREWYFDKCEHGVFINRGHRTQCTRCKSAYQEYEADRRVKEAARVQRENEELRQRELRSVAERREAARRIHEIAHLKKMPPVVFEEFIRELFRRLGWEVQSTPLSGDNGIDGILRKTGGIKGILQCKRFGGHVVGEPIVRDLYGVMHKERAHFGCLVTTSEFSKQAAQWVNGLDVRIELIGGDQLLELVHRTFANEAELPEGFGITEDEERVAGVCVCPRCGNLTRTVHGRYGDFIGCTGYPQCTWTGNLGARRKKKHRRRRRRW